MKTMFKLYLDLSYLFLSFLLVIQSIPLSHAQAIPNTYNSSGIPQTKTVRNYSALYSRIVPAVLQDKRKINPNYLSLDPARTNVTLRSDANISITFLQEGAGFQNWFGYFTYTGNTPPTNPTLVPIFPNVSLEKGLKSGDTVLLGKFTAGTKIGFGIVSNGFNNSSNGGYLTGSNYQKFFSLRNLNPNAPSTIYGSGAYSSLKIDTKNNPVQRIAYFWDSVEQVGVIGFDDQLSGDYDFDDVVFTISSDPADSIGPEEDDDIPVITVAGVLCHQENNGNYTSIAYSGASARDTLFNTHTGAGHEDDIKNMATCPAKKTTICHIPGGQDASAANIISVGNPALNKGHENGAHGGDFVIDINNPTDIDRCFSTLCRESDGTTFKKCCNIKVDPKNFKESTEILTTGNDPHYAGQSCAPVNICHYDENNLDKPTNITIAGSDLALHIPAHSHDTQVASPDDVCPPIVIPTPTPIVTPTAVPDPEGDVCHADPVELPAHPIYSITANSADHTLHILSGQDVLPDNKGKCPKHEVTSYTICHVLARDPITNNITNSVEQVITQEEHASHFTISTSHDFVDIEKPLVGGCPKELPDDQIKICHYDIPEYSEPVTAPVYKVGSVITGLEVTLTAEHLSIHAGEGDFKIVNDLNGNACKNICVAGCDIPVIPTPETPTPVTPKPNKCETAYPNDKCCLDVNDPGTPSWKECCESPSGNKIGTYTSDPHFPDRMCGNKPDVTPSTPSTPVTPDPEYSCALTHPGDACCVSVDNSYKTTWKPCCSSPSGDLITIGKDPRNQDISCEETPPTPVTPTPVTPSPVTCATEYGSGSESDKAKLACCADVSGAPVVATEGEKNGYCCKTLEQGSCVDTGEKCDPSNACCNQDTGKLIISGWGTDAKTCCGDDCSALPPPPEIKKNITFDILNFILSLLSGYFGAQSVTLCTPTKASGAYSPKAFGITMLSFTVLSAVNSFMTNWRMYLLQMALSSAISAGTGLISNGLSGAAEGAGKGAAGPFGTLASMGGSFEKVADANGFTDMATDKVSAYGNVFTSQNGLQQLTQTTTTAMSTAITMYGLGPLLASSKRDQDPYVTAMEASIDSMRMSIRSLQRTLMIIKATLGGMVIVDSLLLFEIALSLKEKIVTTGLDSFIPETVCKYKPVTSSGTSQASKKENTSKDESGNAKKVHKELQDEIGSACSKGKTCTAVIVSEDSSGNKSTKTVSLTYNDKGQLTEQKITGDGVTDPKFKPVDFDGKSGCGGGQTCIGHAANKWGDTKLHEVATFNVATEFVSQCGGNACNITISSTDINHATNTIAFKQIDSQAIGLNLPSQPAGTTASRYNGRQGSGNYYKVGFLTKEKDFLSSTVSDDVSDLNYETMEGRSDKQAFGSVRMNGDPDEYKLDEKLGNQEINKAYKSYLKLQEQLKINPENTISSADYVHINDGDPDAYPVPKDTKVWIGPNKEVFFQREGEDTWNLSVVAKGSIPITPMLPQEPVYNPNPMKFYGSYDVQAGISVSVTNLDGKMDSVMNNYCTQNNTPRNTRLCFDGARDFILKRNAEAAQTNFYGQEFTTDDLTRLKSQDYDQHINLQYSTDPQRIRINKVESFNLKDFLKKIVGVFSIKNVLAGEKEDKEKEQNEAVWVQAGVSLAATILITQLVLMPYMEKGMLFGWTRGILFAGVTTILGIMVSKENGYPGKIAELCSQIEFTYSQISDYCNKMSKNTADSNEVQACQKYMEKKVRKAKECEEGYNEFESIKVEQVNNWQHIINQIAKPAYAQNKSIQDDLDVSFPSPCYKGDPEKGNVQIDATCECKKTNSCSKSNFNIATTKAKNKNGQPIDLSAVKNQIDSKIPVEKYFKMNNEMFNTLAKGDFDGAMRKVNEINKTFDFEKIKKINDANLKKINAELIKQNKKPVEFNLTAQREIANLTDKIKGDLNKNGINLSEQTTGSMLAYEPIKNQLKDYLSNLFPMAKNDLEKLVEDRASNQSTSTNNNFKLEAEDLLKIQSKVVKNKIAEKSTTTINSSNVANKSNPQKIQKAKDEEYEEVDSINYNSSNSIFKILTNRYRKIFPD